MRNVVPASARLSGAAAMVAVYGLLAACLWMTSGNLAKSGVSHTVVWILFAVPTFIAIFWEWRWVRRPAMRRQSVPLVDAPTHSVPVTVDVDSGYTEGRLFVDRGALIFRGERFDFSLSRADLVDAERALQKARRWGLGADLTVPEGLSLHMSITAARRRWKDLRQLLDEWKTTSEAGAPSTLPPVEDQPPPGSFEYLRELLLWLPFAAGGAVGMVAFSFFAPPEFVLNHVRPVQWFICGFSLPMLLSFSELLDIWKRRRRRRSVLEQAALG